MRACSLPRRAYHGLFLAAAAKMLAGLRHFMSRQRGQCHQRGSARGHVSASCSIGGRSEALGVIDVAFHGQICIGDDRFRRLAYPSADAARRVRITRCRSTRPAAAGRTAQRDGNAEAGGGHAAAQWLYASRPTPVASLQPHRM